MYRHLLILIIALTAAQAEAQQKKPWEWSLDERLARRVAMPVEGGHRHIDGRVAPELFMPAELHRLFLLQAFDEPDPYGLRKGTYVEKAVAAGLPADFLDAIAADAADYVAAVREVSWWEEQPVQSTNNGGTYVSMLKRTRPLPAAHAA